MPRLILMCGLPGAGKTTRARQLAELVPAVRLCPDEWLTQLDLDLFDEPARGRIERVLWRLAQDLLRRGVNVILEYGFWSRAERDDKRLAARAMGVAVELHVPSGAPWRAPSAHPGPRRGAGRDNPRSARGVREAVQGAGYGRTGPV